MEFSSFETKNEADSNDTSDYSQDDKPSTGMIVFIMHCITTSVVPSIHHIVVLYLNECTYRSDIFAVRGITLIFRAPLHYNLPRRTLSAEVGYIYDS